MKEKNNINRSLKDGLYLVNGVTVRVKDGRIYRVTNGEEFIRRISKSENEYYDKLGISLITSTTASSIVNQKVKEKIDRKEDLSENLSNE